MSEYIEGILQSEDLRLYDLSDEENPVHLDNETMTLANLKFCDGQKLLVEGEFTCSTVYHLSMLGVGNYLCMLRFLCNLEGGRLCAQLASVPSE